MQKTPHLDCTEEISTIILLVSAGSDVQAFSTQLLN